MHFFLRVPYYCHLAVHFITPVLCAQVFGSDESQHSVYEESVRPIVEDVCRGYNGTIMAYG